MENEKTTTPEQQGQETPTVLENPYIKILEDIIHKRKGRRSPDNLLRFSFARFCANVWDTRYSRIFGYRTDPEALKKYDGDDAIGGPLSMEETSKLTQIDQMKKRLIERIVDWLVGLNNLTYSLSSDILSRNYDRDIIFSCLSDVKADFGKKGDQILYIKKDDLDRFKPYFDRLDNLKATAITNLRACDVVSQVICKNYSVPSDAFRTLNPSYAKRLRGTNATAFIDSCFFCRFSDRKDVNMLSRVMATGSFFRPNDYSIITVLSTSVIHDPNKVFELRQRLKASEGLSFAKWLEENSGANGVYALENPTIDDYFI